MSDPTTTGWGSHPEWPGDAPTEPTGEIAGERGESTLASTNARIDVQLTCVNGVAGELKRLYVERAEAMQEAARAGATLEQIGRAAGVTRERVRQILAGHLKALDSAPHAGLEENRSDG